MRNLTAGGVSLCTKDANGGHMSAIALAQMAKPPMVVPYVY
jgi:hypothetical protein